MDLFKVNRFTGDEAEVSTKQPQLILDRLHQKALEKKRRLQKDSGTPGKKKGKRRGCREKEDTIPGEGTQEGVENTQSSDGDVMGEIPFHCTVKKKTNNTDDVKNIDIAADPSKVHGHEKLQRESSESMGTVSSGMLWSKVGLPHSAGVEDLTSLSEDKNQKHGRKRNKGRETSVKTNDQEDDSGVGPSPLTNNHQDISDRSRHKDKKRKRRKLDNDCKESMSGLQEYGSRSREETKETEDQKIGDDSAEKHPVFGLEHEDDREQRGAGDEAERSIRKKKKKSKEIRDRGNDLSSVEDQQSQSSVHDEEYQESVGEQKKIGNDTSKRKKKHKNRETSGGKIIDGGIIHSDAGQVECKAEGEDHHISDGIRTKKHKRREEDVDSDRSKSRTKLNHAQVADGNDTEDQGDQSLVGTLGDDSPGSKKKKAKKRRKGDPATEEHGTEGDKEVTDGPSEEGAAEPEGAMFPVLGDFTHAKKQKVTRVLPEWLSKPTKISSDIKHHSVDRSLVSGLDNRILAALDEMKISSFFPVQAKVIPLVLQSARHGVFTGPAGYRPGDLCVAAPTGSGKTLAFAIPIVQIIMDRVVQRLRALVVLPTKDLATQVYKVFLQLTRGTPLKVVMIGGQRTLKDEGALLVKQSVSGENLCASDIVVATPGRLMDHINHTEGFTLRHLRLLVIDEADNLMVQHSKDWIARVEREIEGSRSHSRDITVESEARMEMPFQKLLFSATLSHNPEHLIHFKLFQPRLVTSVTSHDQQVTNGEASEDISPSPKYVTPASLEEYCMVCDIGDKPLLVVHLLKNLGCTQVLCFTNSVEASHRLYLLMAKMAGIKVGEFSSKLSGAQRQSMIKQFKNETIQLLICSDVMARGMDLSNVKFVVSYDAPLHLKTYVHRVGRTARAGRKGTAYTILLESEVDKFERVVGRSSATGIKRITVEDADLEPFKEDYQRSLKRLPLSLKDEIYQQKNR